MSASVDSTLNPNQLPVDSSCDPVRPLNPPLIALPTFLDEHITASFRKKVTLNGRIKSKRKAIETLVEHDTNGTCPKSLQISHEMSFSDNLREMDSDFVKIQSEYFEEIKTTYMKKATQIALHVQREELKTLNIMFGNLDTEVLNSICLLFDAQQNASYPTFPLSRAIVLGRETKFCGRYTGEFHFPYLIELAYQKYHNKWSEYLDGLNDRMALKTIKAQALAAKRAVAEDTEMGLPDETKIKNLVHQVANDKFKKLETMIRGLSKSPNQPKRNNGKQPKNRQAGSKVPKPSKKPASGASVVRTGPNKRKHAAVSSGNRNAKLNKHSKRGHN